MRRINTDPNPEALERIAQALDLATVALRAMLAVGIIAFLGALAAGGM